MRKIAAVQKEIEKCKNNGDSPNWLFFTIIKLRLKPVHFLMNFYQHKIQFQNPNGNQGNGSMRQTRK